MPTPYTPRWISEPGEAYDLLVEHGDADGQRVCLHDEAGEPVGRLADAHPAIRAGYEFFARHRMAHLVADADGEHIELTVPVEVLQ